MVAFNFITHITFSLLFGVIHLRIYDTSTFSLPVFIAALIISSILPDIDTRNSKVNQYNPFALLTSKMTHRGVTHSLLFVVSVTTIVSVIFKNEGITIGVFIGYSSHLLTDYFTKQGISLLYPVKKAYYKSPISIPNTVTSNSFITTVNLFVAIYISRGFF